MDLTNKTSINTKFSVNEHDVMTIEFIDPANSVYPSNVLGSIIIENVKYRALMRSLELVSSERVISLEAQSGHRTKYREQAGEAEIIFT